MRLHRRQPRQVQRAGGHDVPDRRRRSRRNYGLDPARTRGRRHERRLRPAHAAERIVCIGYKPGELDATKEPGEPNHAGNPGGHSLWYSWTAPAAGDTTVDTCDSNFDTLLAVYRGDALGSLTALTSDDDGCVACEGSFAEFTAEQGVTYRIAVDGYYGATGNFDLYVELTPPV